FREGESDGRSKGSRQIFTASKQRLRGSGRAAPSLMESVESHSGPRAHAQLCDGMMQSLFLSLNTNRIINMPRGAGHVAADNPSSSRMTEQEEGSPSLPNNHLHRQSLCTLDAACRGDVNAVA